MKTFLASKHWKFGVPFLTLGVGASYGLKYFTSIRYDPANSKGRYLTSEEKRKQDKEGMPALMLQNVDLEKALKDHVGEDRMEDWENIRGPRPWEPHPQANPDNRKKGAGKHVRFTETKTGRELTDEEVASVRANVRDSMAVPLQPPADYNSPGGKIPSHMRADNPSPSDAPAPSQNDAAYTADEVSAMFTKSTSRSSDEQSSYDDDLLSRAMAAYGKDNTLKS